MFEAFVSKLGWATENGVVIVPPNPDNQIRSTVVHETISLPRTLCKSLPVSQLTVSHRASQGHYTFSQDSVTFPLHLLYDAMLLTFAREKDLQRSVHYAELFYDNMLDRRGRKIYTRWGILNHDELFVALRLVHDMWGSRFASCAPFERELRLASCTL